MPTFFGYIMSATDDSEYSWWVEGVGQWWREDLCRPALLVGGFLWAAFIAQALPFWDGDFTIYFRGMLGKSMGRLLWEWIAPISTNPESWGFLGGAVQFLAYKVSYQIAGYDPWPYSFLRGIYVTRGWESSSMPGSAA